MILDGLLDHVRLIFAVSVTLLAGQGNTSIVVAPEASPIGFVLRRASVQNVINTTLSNVEYHNGSLALKGDLALSPEAHALPTRNGMVAFIEKYMQPFHKNVSDPNQILEFWPSDEQQPPGSWCAVFLRL